MADDDGDSRELLAQMDALLQRHRGVYSPHADADIPVLTDVVEQKVAADSGDDWLETVTESSLPPEVSAASFRHLGSEVTREVLKMLDAHVGPEIPPSLLPRLVEALHVTLDRAFADLPARIARSVNAAIAQAWQKRLAEDAWSAPDQPKQDSGQDD